MSKHSFDSAQKSEHTVISRSLVIQGELGGSEDLVIHGKVEGSIILDGAEITVAEGGRVEGDIFARSVRIAGTVKGTINAQEQLLIEASARVTADVEASCVELREGCFFKGRIEMGEANSGTVEELELVEETPLSRTA